MYNASKQLSISHGYTRQPLATLATETQNTTNTVSSSRDTAWWDRGDRR